MPPPQTSTERQKLLIQAEIARLQGQIASSKHSQPSSYHGHHPYRGSSRGGRGGGYRGSYRGRGRGRGGSQGSYSVDFRGSSNNQPTASASSSVAPSTTPSTEREEGEVSPPPGPGPGPAPAQAKSAPSAGDGWVKKTSRGGNMSLMTVQKRNELSSRPPPPRRARVPSQVQVLQSTAEPTEGGEESKRVVIDGVIFQFEQGGKKLTRIGELPSSGPSKSTSQGTPTRLKYGGESYRRTKRGNLVSRATLNAKRAEQAKKPCRYFTKTGRCALALTCPYQHIPERVSICPAFLSKKGCNLGDSCPLSHTPSAHNTPSCIHFQASASCYNDKCPYPHVSVAPDAPVCEQFAREGWCERDEGTCPELHVWECPEFHAKGTCSRQPRCGLPHVVHAEKLKKAKAAADAAAKGSEQLESGSFEDQADFIGFPGEVFSDTESEEEDADDDEDDDDVDEDSDEVEAMEEDERPGKASDTDDEDDEARVMEDL